MFRGSSKSEPSKGGGGSLKWITAQQTARGPTLSVEKRVSREIFEPCGRSTIGLISIFGAARQGKSFLMNCLAGETDLFRISNERESCTQGIDVSTHLLDLSQFAAGGAKGVTTSSSLKKFPAMKVGFVDAEGQGDKDMSYDANLVCPILLASKCVIFNWKDSLQKDRILQLLGVMHKAAINVAEDGDIDVQGGGSESKVFGHLHVVFRDWQYVDSTPEKVHDDVFKDERSADTDARLRNAIRSDIKSSFQSITVWLLPPPVLSASKLSSKLKVEDTSEEFKTQLSALRARLAAQMSEPMKFAGKPFSGKTIGPLIAQVVESLNSGEAVRPMSAYTNMLRQEVDKHRLEIEDALRRISEKHIAELGKVDVKKANTDYPSEEKVKIAFLKEFDEVTAQFQDETAETLSSLPPDLAKQLTKDANSSIEHVKKSGLDQLNAVYRNGISAWIESLQESFQLKLTAAIEKLEKEELPLADEALQARLEVIFQSIVLSALTTNRVDATYRSKVEDCVTSLKKYFDLRGDICMKKNELQGQAQISKVREVIEEAMETMRGFVHSQSLMYRARPAGFLLKDLINDLNAKYQSVEEQLKKSIARLRPSLVTEAVGELETFCVEMSRQIDADFKNMLVDAYQTVTADAISHLQKKVDMLQNLDTLEEEAHKITEEVFAEALNKLKDWTPSKAQEEMLMEALNTQCSASILLKSRRLEEERLIYERELMAARLREEENAIKVKRLTLSAKKGRQGKTPSKLYEFAPMDLGGESANKDEAVPVKASGSKRALLSVAEQRARAAAWALEEANKKVVASSGSASTKRKNGASVADVVAPLKKDAVEDAISEARKEELERAEAAARSLTDTSNLPHESGRKRSRKSLTGERF